MRNFTINDKFLGYQNKGDKTKIDHRYLVEPSQNVIIDSADKLKIRPGYELDGPAGTTNKPIRRGYDWNTSTGTENNLRVTDTEIQYRYVASDGTVTYRTLKDGYSDTAVFNFAEWWDTTEVMDMLLFVNGTSTLGMWGGGVTDVASVTTNTITKSGSTTWAEERFLTASGNKVVIGGAEYTYTGGAGTTTLTGVTPDPAAAGVSSGDIVHQAIVETADIISADFKIKTIGVLKNQVYLAGTKYRDVYVSSNSDYTDYTFTSPVRLPGEGALLTLDSNPVGFVSDEGTMYITAKRDDWYRVVFTLSSDLTGESLTIQKLKSGPGQGALGQSAIANIKNAILYINNDKDIDTLGRVQNIETPQSDPISDQIKNLLEGYDYTIDPHIVYHKGKTNIVIPSSGVRLIYDHELAIWNPPQLMPIRYLAIIGDELYGHSGATDETYKLDVGTSDNGKPITAKAYFAYNNFGRRDWEKKNDEFFHEGYISRNTTLTTGILYDYDGYTGKRSWPIKGSDDGILFLSSADASIGKDSLGKQPLGGTTSPESALNKFRTKIETPQRDSYEFQLYYSSDKVDDQWEILAMGSNTVLSTNDDSSIKR